MTTADSSANSSSAPARTLSASALRDRLARGRFLRAMAMLALVTIAASVAALAVGRFPIGAEKLFAALSPWDDAGRMIENVVWNVRAPRVVLALLAGAGLAMAGAAFQALFSNPLAAPDTLGVATGASFGAVLGILLGAGALLVQSLALVFGLAAVALVMLIARRRDGGTPILMIVLSGIVVGSFFTALVSLVKFVADPQDVLPAVTFWLMGSLTGASFSTLAAGFPMAALGAAVLLLLRWRLNAAALPEDEAKSLGIPVGRIRAAVILGATMLTASVVSMCGLIGWVGLLVPHAVRMAAGADNRRVLPASALAGALFMLLVDTAARTMTAGEVPVSILTALVGAPFFIHLLRRTGGLTS